MSNEPPVPPFDGEVKNQTINVHYHPKGPPHWRIVLTPTDDKPLSEDQENELDLDGSIDHRLLVYSGDEDKENDFLLTMLFQPDPSDDPASRLRSRDLPDPTLYDNTLIYAFKRPKKPSGQEPAPQEFTYRPLGTDNLSLTATGDDPRFKIKLKT